MCKSLLSHLRRHSRGNQGTPNNLKLSSLNAKRLVLRNVFGKSTSRDSGRHVWQTTLEWGLSAQSYLVGVVSPFCFFVWGGAKPSPLASDLHTWWDTYQKLSLWYARDVGYTTAKYLVAAARAAKWLIGVERLVGPCSTHRSALQCSVAQSPNSN